MNDIIRWSEDLNDVRIAVKTPDRLTEGVRIFYPSGIRLEVKPIKWLSLLAGTPTITTSDGRFIILDPRVLITGLDGRVFYNPIHNQFLPKWASLWMIGKKGPEWLATVEAAEPPAWTGPNHEVDYESGTMRKTIVVDEDATVSLKNVLRGAGKHVEINCTCGECELLATRVRAKLEEILKLMKDESRVTLIVRVPNRGTNRPQPYIIGNDDLMQALADAWALTKIPPVNMSQKNSIHGFLFYVSPSEDGVAEFDRRTPTKGVDHVGT